MHFPPPSLSLCMSVCAAASLHMLLPLSAAWMSIEHKIGVDVMVYMFRCVPLVVRLVESRTHLALCVHPGWNGLVDSVGFSKASSYSLCCVLRFHTHSFRMCVSVSPYTSIAHTSSSRSYRCPEYIGGNISNTGRWRWT